MMDGMSPSRITKNRYAKNTKILLKRHRQNSCRCLFFGYFSSILILPEKIQRLEELSMAFGNLKELGMIHEV